MRKTTRNRKNRLFFALCAILLGAIPAAAQSNEDISSVLQFNFSNPGARSLGMAGAFAARADDATAVYANPAGLIQLSRPEFSMDGRSWNFANRYLASGTQINPSNLSGLSYDESDDNLEGVSFLSGFYPGRSGRWVAGLFRHQAVNFETALSTNDATVFTQTGTGFARPRDGDLNLELDTTGASMAFRLHPRLSLGATLSRWEFAFDTRLELYDAPRDQESGDPVFNPFSLDDPYPGLTEGDPEICCEYGNRGDIIRLRTQTGRDDATSYSLGLFWESARTEAGVPLVTLGGVYRKGPSFRFTGRSYIRSLRPTVSLPTTRQYLSVFGDVPGIFKVPDVWSVGASLRPGNRWVISADWARVEYSDLMDRFLDLAGRDSGIPNGQIGRAVDYRLEDGDEIRLGFEYVANADSGNAPIFLRWGLWNDPNHEIEYVGPDPSQRPIFSPGSDELHTTVGIGIKFRNSQFDLGYDRSERVDTLSFSSVFYFGRN